MFVLVFVFVCTNWFASNSNGDWRLQLVVWHEKEKEKGKGKKRRPNCISGKEQ